MTADQLQRGTNSIFRKQAGNQVEFFPRGEQIERVVEISLVAGPDLHRIVHPDQSSTICGTAPALTSICFHSSTLYGVVPKRMEASRLSSADKFLSHVLSWITSVAAGLVTEFGGLLSHSGVVAREYGLPAVLGVGEVMRLLHDGNEIEVDGERGEVRVR